MPFVLDLLRHGEAEGSGPAGDETRALTRAGEETLHALGVRLARDGWRVGRAFSSPLLRARQSAAIVLAAAEVALVPTTLAELRSETSPRELAAALASHAENESHVLAVGHMPLLGELTAFLAGSPMPFQAGSLVRLESPDGAWDRAGGARVILALHPPYGSGAR